MKYYQVLVPVAIFTYPTNLSNSRHHCTDIRKIIPAEILPDSLAGGIARVANLKNSKVVTSPSGKKACLLFGCGSFDYKV